MKTEYILAVLLVLFPLCIGEGGETPGTGDTGKTEIVVEFMPSFLEAMAEAEATGKPLFAYFHSQSCGYCRLFEAEVLTDPEVEKVLEGFVAVQVDIDKEPSLAGNMGIVGTPTIVFLTVQKVEGTNRTSADEVDRIIGYVSKERFLEALEEYQRPT
jgi:thioredoxin-related protein